jgi:hypothetical protein
MFPARRCASVSRATSGSLSLSATPTIPAQDSVGNSAPARMERVMFFHVADKQYTFIE